MNEATTCDWIIRPLLHAAGYKRNEILPQGIDANNQKPDYTILPNSEHTWFLEAKAWNNELSDVHVKQSLVYAFTNNRRWAVLTNGQQWRLYDNRIEGELAAKLVCEVALADVEAAVRFLEAIGPDSMTGGGIEAFAQNGRLAHALTAELSDPESALIKAAHRIMRTQYGLQYNEPRHPDPGAMHKFAPVTVNGQTVYMDKHRSASNLVAQLTALCRASGLSPDLIRVRLRG